MKKLLLCILFLWGVFILLPPVVAFAAVNAEGDTNGNIEEKTRLNLQTIDEVVEKLDGEISQAVPNFSFQQMVEEIKQGKFNWNMGNILNGALKYIFSEVRANASLLGKLVVLSIVTAILNNMMSAFEKGTTGKMAYFVCYLVLITLAVGTFSLAINLGREAINNMVTFMQALLPFLITLLAAMGGVVSATIFHPLVLGSVSVIGTLIKNVILPLIFFAAVLNVLNGISSKFKVSRMADLLKSISMILLGLCSTVFLGVLAVQGVAGAVSDGVALRTAKYTAGAFVPVVGGTFSDALEAVVGSALLMKNAVGIAGVVIIALLTLLPLIKIIAIFFIYRLAGAIIQPVGDSQMADTLTSLGNSLLAVFGAVAVAGLLFFFAITVVVGMGNLTVMLR